MAVSNIVEPGDKVLVVVTGVFGERFAKIARAFSAQVITLEFKAGTQANPEDIRAALKENPDTVSYTHLDVYKRQGYDRQVLLIRQPLGLLTAMKTTGD